MNLVFNWLLICAWSSSAVSPAAETEPISGRPTWPPLGILTLIWESSGTSNTAISIRSPAPSRRSPRSSPCTIVLSLRLTSAANELAWPRLGVPAAEATGTSAGIAGTEPVKARGSGWRWALLHEASASPATTVTAQADNLRISPPNFLRDESLIRAGGRSRASTGEPAASQPEAEPVEAVPEPPKHHSGCCCRHRHH